MDFAYSGDGPAKRLELNDDTPTSLYEAGFFQWVWLEQAIAQGILPRHADQYNSIQELFEEANSPPLPAGWVRKPFFSREGSNIELVTPAGLHEAVDGPYTDSPWIRQAYHPMPRIGNNHALIGSWVVGDRACGMGIREDVGRITQDSSCFVPHAIV